MGTPVGDIPIGGSINFLTLFGAPIEWIVIGKDLPGMPENSITLYMKYIVAIRCFDAMEPSNPDDNRKRNGNNDWGISNLRQWANSAAGPGEWYSPQHAYDAPPDTAEHCNNYNPYQADAGFLNESTAHDRSLLMKTTRNYGGHGNTSNGKTCVDKLFALTITELGYSVYVDLGNDGTKIPYFTDNNSRLAQCTAECIADSDFKYNGLTSEAWIYCTATSNGTAALYAVNRDGVMGLPSPYAGNLGVRLACNIPANARL